MANIHVSTDEAKKAAQDIARSASELAKSFGTLKQEIDTNFTELNKCTWGKKLVEDWNQYNSNEIGAALDNINIVANNITAEIQAAEQIDQLSSINVGN